MSPPMNAYTVFPSCYFWRSDSVPMARRLLLFVPDEEQRLRYEQALDDLGEESAAGGDGAEEQDQAHEAYVIAAQELVEDVAKAVNLEQLTGDDQNAGWGDGFWLCRRGCYDAEEMAALR